MCRPLLSDLPEAAMLHPHENLCSQVLFGRTCGDAGKYQLICSHGLEVGRPERCYALFGSTCSGRNTGRSKRTNLRFERSDHSSAESAAKAKADAIVSRRLSRHHHYVADERANLHGYGRRSIRCSNCRASRAIKRQCSPRVRRIDSLRTEFQEYFLRAERCGARSSLANGKRSWPQWPGTKTKCAGNLLRTADQHASQEEIAAYLGAAALWRTSPQGTTRRATWLSCCAS